MPPFELPLRAREISNLNFPALVPEVVEQAVDALQLVHDVGELGDDRRARVLRQRAAALVLSFGPARNIGLRYLLCEVDALDLLADARRLRLDRGEHLTARFDLWITVKEVTVDRVHCKLAHSHIVIGRHASLQLGDRLGCLLFGELTLETLTARLQLIEVL